MSTLRELREYGATVTVYCLTTGNPPCSNSWRPSLDQLVQYFGLDFDIHERRGEFLGRMICERCGQRNVQTIWQPPSKFGDRPDGTGAAHVEIEWNAELRNRISKESDWARISIQQQVQFRIDQRETRRKERRAQKVGQGQLIGPPNPFSTTRPKLTR